MRKSERFLPPLHNGLLPTRFHMIFSYFSPSQVAKDEYSQIIPPGMRQIRQEKRIIQRKDLSRNHFHKEVTHMPSRSEQDFIRLVDQYSRLLTGLCVISLRDMHLAQDVVQETFLRA